MGYDASSGMCRPWGLQESTMGAAFESIRLGLSEVKAYHEGKIRLKTTSIEIPPEPVNVAEPDPSYAPVAAKRDGTDGDQHER